MKKGRFAFVFVLFIAFAVDCSAQTLADVARKERERLKTLRSIITVTSHEAGAASTISSGTAGTTPAVVSASTGPTAAQKPTGPLDNQGRDEKYWRGAFQKARDDVKRAEEKAQLLDLKIKDMNTQLLRNSSIYNRENQLGPEIATAQKELDTARKESELAKQRIVDLEDELRRAGGLPGWAR